jgi:hypothetical protein
MHIPMETLISGISQANAEQLDQLQQAINRRRQQMAGGPLSTVVERRDYRNGVLQLERRAYRRKDGGLTERGPYWYFHFREGGRQKTMYVGQADDPEARVDEIMTKRRVNDAQHRHPPSGLSSTPACPPTNKQEADIPSLSR